MLRLPGSANGSAAGIENEDGGCGTFFLQPLGKAGDGEGGIAHQSLFAWPSHRHIDGQEIVGAVDGEAMAGEIDECGVAAFDLALKLDKGAAHGAAPDILSRHHLEAERCKLLRHGLGVVHRLLQMWHVLIVVIADDKSDPLGGICRDGGHTAHESSEAESPNLAFGVPHAWISAHGKLTT